MKHIRKILDDDELLIDCGICGRMTVMHDEDTCFCSGCGNEIEHQNIDAWTEFAELKGDKYMEQMRKRKEEDWC